MGKIIRRNAKKNEAPADHHAEKLTFLEDIIPDINKGSVIPIISNSFRIEEIFRDEDEITGKIAQEPEFTDEDLTIDEQLTKEWAADIKYPMSDDHNLARVAQYYQVDRKDSRLAKVKYLEFLNNYLLDINLDDGTYKDVVAELRDQPDLLFSEIVRQLDYPRDINKATDPMNLLARLPLPLYITTSYYDFMERALKLAGKTPHTQVCFWNGGISGAKPEHQPDPDFIPDANHPIVYHLFGLEDYPNSLVLSEDDYLNFLVSVVEDTNTQYPLIPLRLREALVESRLVLLGYHLRDWDFRVLFRFIQKYRKSESAQRGIIIQLIPGSKGKENVKKSMRYLSQYFDKKQFEVEWSKTESFIHTLWNKWDKSRRGLS